MSLDEMKEFEDLKKQHTVLLEELEEIKEGQSETIEKYKMDIVNEVFELFQNKGFEPMRPFDNKVEINYGDFSLFCGYYRNQDVYVNKSRNTDLFKIKVKTNIDYEEPNFNYLQDKEKIPTVKQAIKNIGSLINASDNLTLNYLISMPNTFNQNPIVRNTAKEVVDFIVKKI